MKKLLIFCVVAFVCLCSDSIAHTITLSGKVRDFYSSHPDFEINICDHQVGLVDENLGSDKNPVFGPNGYNCIDSPQTFTQWYNDLEGTNTATFISLTLDNGQNEAGGVYTYENSYFFPIDDKLFGNEGRSHNYHFTLEVHTTFTYVGGETFSFNGYRVRIRLDSLTCRNI